MKKLKKVKTEIGFDIFIKANRKASREIELEQNGGRWVAKDRPHKNKKAYDRKRDKKINFDLPLFFISIYIYLI